jgi:hypothetical protein
LPQNSPAFYSMLNSGAGEIMKPPKRLTKWLDPRCWAIAALLASYAAAAPAAVILTNDAAFGANSVIRDLDNDRDFLQLVLTQGFSYNGVLAELGAGGDFEGWSIASTAQLEALGVSAAITNGSSDPGQVATAEELRDWFCIRGADSCVNLSTTHEYARGLVIEDGPDFPNGEPSKEAFSIGRRFNVDPNEVDFRISGFGGLNAANEEVYLTRRAVAVAEPATAALVATLLGALALFRRRQN